VSIAKWLYRYVFRGIGWVLVAAAATVLAVPVMNSCGSRMDPKADARQKAETKKVLKRMHENADEEIRKFNRSQMQKPAPPQPVEEGQ
jgi:hypothetical protein